MPKTYTLAWATPTDYAELADVIFDAVRNGPSKYTEAQRVAWVSERKRGVEWAARLAGQAITVASDANGVVGFMSLERGGYIDFAFIRPEHKAPACSGDCLRKSKNKQMSKAKLGFGFMPA